MAYRLKSAPGAPVSRNNYILGICFTSQGVLNITSNKKSHLVKRNNSLRNKFSAIGGTKQINKVVEKIKTQKSITNDPKVGNIILKQREVNKKEITPGEEVIMHYYDSNHYKVKYSNKTLGIAPLNKSRLTQNYDRPKCFRVGYRIVQSKIKKMKFSVWLQQNIHLEGSRDRDDKTAYLINIHDKNSYIQLPGLNQLDQYCSLMTIIRGRKQKICSQLKYYGRVLNNYENSLRKCIFICILNHMDGCKNLAQRIFFWVGRPINTSEKALVMTWIEQFIKDVKINDKQLIKQGQIIWVLDWLGNHSYFTYLTNKLANIH